MASGALITREQMFAPLLIACPTFSDCWHAFVAQWEDESEPPLYLALADLARHLIAQLASRETEAFPEVFAVVEQWHLLGDDYVREAACIGLLEALQNTSLHQSTMPDDFLPWLQPETARGWEKVSRFWSDGDLMVE